ncbi:hypothetical protein OIO90_001866 [Microbotryomycetes sp. JL221]|nr:hypothetical protein OIO90_001866 [Microbotryomycetes sp. JL221]
MATSEATSTLQASRASMDASDDQRQQQPPSREGLIDVGSTSRFTEEFGETECWPSIHDLEDAGLLDSNLARVAIAEHIESRGPFPEELQQQRVSQLHQEWIQQQEHQATTKRRWSRQHRPPALELVPPTSLTTSSKMSSSPSPRLSPLMASVVRKASRFRPSTKRTKSTNDVATVEPGSSISVHDANLVNSNVKSRAMPWKPTRTNSASPTLENAAGHDALPLVLVTATNENARPSFDSEDQVMRQPRKLVRKSVQQPSTRPQDSDTLSSASDNNNASTPLLSSKTNNSSRSALPNASQVHTARTSVAPPRRSSTGQTQRRRSTTRSSNESYNGDEEREHARKTSLRRNRRLGSDSSAESVVDEHGYIHYNSRSLEVASPTRRSRPLPSRSQSDSSEIERQRRNVGSYELYGTSQSSLDLERIEEQTESSPAQSRTMSRRTSQRQLPLTTKGSSGSRTRTPSSNTTVGPPTLTQGTSQPSSPGRTTSPRSSRSLKLAARDDDDVVANVRESSSETEDDSDIVYEPSKVHSRSLALQDSDSPSSTPELVFGRHYRRQPGQHSQQIDTRGVRSLTVSSSQDEGETSSSSLLWNSASEGLPTPTTSDFGHDTVDERQTRRKPSLVELMARATVESS